MTISLTLTKRLFDVFCENRMRASDVVVVVVA